MSTLAERKQAELEAKRRSLSEEVGFWLGLAAEDGPLQKHHSQLRRLAQMLDAALGGLEASADVVAVWAADTERLLGLHHVWDFFRSKLALRLVDRFRPALVAADELAWACVQPFLRAAVAAGGVEATAVREPALVYFDAAGSPFAVARHQAYRNLLPAKRLDEVPAGLLKRLPVPVIGIPWHQQAHLPESAIVAHEAAHVVDDDLDLVDALLPAVEAGAGGDWAGWLPEVLADVLGALQLGPAYRAALADVLVAPAAVGPGSALAPAARYPPPRIRLELVDATLARLGHGLPEDAVALPDGDGVRHGDVEAAVEVLTATKLDVLGGVALVDVDPFGTDRQKQAEGDAERLDVPMPPKSNDARVLIAAGVLAFAHDPAGFGANDVAAKVLARIEAVRDPGTRATPHDRTDEELEADLGRRDAETGDALLALLA